MKKKLPYHKTRKISPFFLLGLCVIGAQLLTGLCLFLLLALWPGLGLQDIYLIGAFVALVAALILGTVILALTNETSRIRAANHDLQNEIALRRSKEEELQKSEDRFKTIFDNSRDGIVVVAGPTRKYLFANPAALEMLGYGIEELRGLRVEQTHPREDAPQVLEAFQAMLEGREPIARDIPFLRRDGSVFFANVHGGRAIFDEKECNLAFIRDAGERRAAELALRESEEKFRFFTDQVSFDGLVIHDDGRYLEVSQPFAEMHGYSPEEMISLPAWSTLPPGEADRIKQVAREKKEDLYEASALKKDGTIFPVEIRARNLLYQGRMVRAAAVRDITIRKSAEKTLREAEERYRSLFERAGDAIFILEAEGEHAGRIVDANLAAAAMHGYTREEVLRMHITDLDDPETARKAPGRIREMLAGKWLKVEGRHVKKDGTVFPIEISAGLIEFGGGKFILAYDRDISERVRAEEERQALEKQLLHSQKLEAVGTLSGGLAHDFNNILQAIGGYVQLMNAKGGLAERQREFLAQIAGAADRGSDLVRRLLTFSRKIEPRLEPVDINKQIQQTIGLLERTLPKMVALSADLKAAPPFIRGDANQLEQVILNLGANAGDAMPQGGAINIATAFEELKEDSRGFRQGLPPGRYIRLTVGDTGHGMDQETIKKIFDPFFTTKAVGRGTGLGLAMVYGIVKNHGGLIECDSRPGQGTTFAIHWPAWEGPRPAAESSSPLETADKVARGSETILVVDDDHSILELTFEALVDQGYQVLTASSGEEALEIFSAKSDHIDLVILDLGMPGMGGYNCLGKLMEIKGDALVLVASGYSPQEITAETKGWGARGFIRKPFKLSELSTSIRAALDHSGEGAVFG
ncbi:MAG: PAS domain S-box protein [Pseudomonadota bacterium]